MTNSSSSSSFNIGQNAKGIIGQNISDSTYIENQTVNVNAPTLSKAEKEEKALHLIDSGNDCLRLDSLDEAMKYFREAIDLDSDVPFAYIGLGTIYFKLGSKYAGKKEFNKAKSRYNDALESFKEAETLYYEDERFLSLADQQERLNKLIQTTLDKISDLDKNRSHGFRLW